MAEAEGAEEEVEEAGSLDWRVESLLRSWVASASCCVCSAQSGLISYAWSCLQSLSDPLKYLVPCQVKMYGLATRHKREHEMLRPSKFDHRP